MRGQGRAERIVVVTSSYPAGPDDPSGHFVGTDVARLRRNGHEVLVLAPRGNDAFGWPGALARLRERPSRALGVLSFVRETRRALRTLGPFDRLVAHFLLPSVWPITDGLERPARRLEAVLHGSDVRLCARLPGIARRRVARALAPFDVRVTSEELRRELGRALGDDVAERASIEPAPIDVPALERARARGELGIALSERLVVVSGRLVPGKRTRVALCAARLVPRAKVVVVGDGPERAALEREFSEAHFVGLVGRARALTWLAAADALVVASREEGAPSVVREARALGTPVVAVPSGDLGAWQRNDPGLFIVSTLPA
jgi:glycosyltransferase involved in cell wall biosynthesis